MLDYNEKSSVMYDIYIAALYAMLNLSDDKKKRLGHDIQDILIDCKFNGGICNASDFSWEFDTFFGNCFVFNSGLNSKNEHVNYKRSQVAGSLFGLNLKFYVNYHESLIPFNSNNYKGAYVRIENNTYFSDDLLYNGIYVSPGKWWNVLINRKVSYILPKPYSSCELDNEIGNKYVKTHLLDLFAYSQYQYTQQSCIIQCLQYETIQECNCTYSLYLSLFEKENCITKDQLECYSRVWIKFLEKNFISVIFFLK
jgi:hypothetical protein